MDSHFDFSSIVKPNIVALKVLGFWRSSHRGSFYNKKWYNAYTATVVLVKLFFEATGYWHLYDKWGNLSLVDINSVIFIYSTGMLNLSMMVIIFFNMESVHFIQSTMKTEAFQPESQAQVEAARKWKAIARYFQILFYGTNTFNNLSLISLALWRDDKLLLVAHKPSFIHWTVFFAFQALSCFYCAQMIATHVTLVTSLLIEIIIQLCMLEKALETVEDIDGVSRCVKWHLQILVFVKKVQHLCEIGVSGVFLCGVINICTSLSLLLEVKYIEMLFVLPYLSELVIIIFCHCWCGSEIIYQSEKILSAIYSTQWMNADESYKKTINLYMLLTKKPLQIHLGGGVTTASLPVFITIIRSAYSVFTILQRFK